MIYYDSCISFTAFSWGKLNPPLPKIQTEKSFLKDPNRKALKVI